MKSLKNVPDVVILHRAIDVEQDVEAQSPDASQKARWALVPKIKAAFADQKLASGKDRVLVAVAGGIEPESAKYALDMGADILIIGRFVSSAKDVENAMRRLLNIIPGYSDIDLKRIHEEDDDSSITKATWD
jgi:3-keto-L-gulonate-6-phosphate decarboxylase